MFPYGPWLAHDGNDIIPNAEGDLYSVTVEGGVGTGPLLAYDLEEQPLVRVASGPKGLIQQFKLAEDGIAWWISGEHQLLVVSWQYLYDTVNTAAGEAASAALSAQAAEVAAEQAESQLPSGGNTGQALVKLSSVDRDVGWGAAAGEGGSSITGAPSEWPSTFPPSPHSHLITDLRRVAGNSLASFILTFLGTTDSQAARAAIGAGTGNGTSNLQLGDTGTTAAPGNHIHSNYTTQPQVQTMIDGSISSAGTAPSGTAIIRRYTAGAYPVRGSVPSGAVIGWLGPVAPPVGGSYFVEGVDLWLQTAA